MASGKTGTGKWEILPAGHCTDSESIQQRSLYTPYCLALAVNSLRVEYSLHTYLGIYLYMHILGVHKTKPFTEGVSLVKYFRLSTITTVCLLAFCISQVLSAAPHLSIKEAKWESGDSLLDVKGRGPAGSECVAKRFVHRELRGGCLIVSQFNFGNTPKRPESGGRYASSPVRQCWEGATPHKIESRLAGRHENQKCPRNPPPD
jgi:hypothetical protein